MADSGMISWHRVTEEVRKLLDKIAEEINTTERMKSDDTTCQLTWMPKESGRNQIYLGVLMGYLIAKIKGPGRRLGYCKLKDDGELYISWTVD